MLDISMNKMVPYYIKRFTKECNLVFAPTALMKTLLLNQGVTTEIEVLPSGLNEVFFQRIQKLQMQ